MIISRSSFKRQIVPDCDPDTSYLEQEGFEEHRARYQRGEFDFIGVRAAVDLPIPYGKGHILTPVTSPGLWGIESDSGEDYLQGVLKEESNVLIEMLGHLGVEVA